MVRAMWRRANLPSCTDKMIEMMKELRSHRDDYGYLFASVDRDPRTAKALLRRDWITKSHSYRKYKEAEYKLTKRGEKALSIYEIPPAEYDERRWDGICCRCGERERGRYANGKQKPYCGECERRAKRRAYTLFGDRTKPGICPDCGEREKHITKSGRVRAYCKPCRRRRAKKYRREKARRELAKVRAGEVLLCYRCHQRPRQVTGNTVQDYCRECNIAYKRQRRMI